MKENSFFGWNLNRKHTPSKERTAAAAALVFLCLFADILL
ncbi:hypothetical protein KNP414_06301 [Paenibacillus mucilaginosus KNP414]|uniref:Uncharacterized protein n=1 Tax=Paenibacillus mucilaginosus (strain KNP414) TaxID=1036673 RepID=F8FLQ6_PAEMK|nr:hypothetical protein KNP414_06301 [Paenibacillus mucilaginosus KNP414]